MKKINVLCLTYGKLAPLVHAALNRIEDPELEIHTVEGVQQELFDIVADKISKGADIIVAGGANAEYARNSFDLPVIQIEITPFDYAETLGRAKLLGDKICIVKYRDGYSYDFEKISSLLEIPFDLVLYEDTEELEEKVKALNPQVIIGGGNANRIADELGCESLLIYPGEDAIVNALQKSKKIFLKLKEQQEKTSLLKTLLNSIPNGVMVIDEHGLITEFNAEAEQYFGISKKEAKRQPVHKILPQSCLEEALVPDFSKRAVLKPINGRMIVDTQIQLRTGQTITGAISLSAEMSHIKKATFEYHLEQEKKNQIKGFTAKSRFENIICNSKSMEKAISDAKIYAGSDSSILITGETGCGKELFAQSIHNFSSRNQEAFIAINCAALPENLLESELFGYEEGAFTGSRKGGKVGIFELAGKGTIFLDEIGELSLPLQARLLRVLQEKEVLRVGGDRLHKVNARIISATNKDIYSLGNTHFRRDLLFRLNVLEVKIPPLCQRQQDILPLFQYFLNQHIHLADRSFPFSDVISQLLQRYSWPGNVRELQNVCERFYLFMEQSKHWNEKAAHRNIIEAIGLDQIVADILMQYGCSSAQEINPKILKKLFQDLKELLHLNNDILAGKLGISRTTAWRLQKNS